MLEFPYNPIANPTIPLPFKLGRSLGLRRRSIGRLGVLAVGGGMSVAAAWMVCCGGDVRGALIGTGFAAASAVVALAWAGSPQAMPLPSPALLGLRGEADAEDAHDGDALAALDERRQADKMETIGRCVGEFAHDLNNLLTVIICNLDRAAQHAVTGSKASSHLADASVASERAANLLADILAFSRQQPALPQLIDIDRVIGAMRPLILSAASDCSVEFELDCDWLCRAETNQLENAVLNLVVNARDAMPGGGCLTLRTGTLSRETDERLGRGGDHVVLTVSDSGVGMTQDVVTRAFQPFFTTKPAGRGTGLGLAQIAGFARRASGSAWIDSAPGQGTRVSIIIPRDRPNADESVTAAIAHAGTMRL